MSYSLHWRRPSLWESCWYWVSATGYWCRPGILADHMQMTCILFFLSALTAGIIGAVNHPNMNWDSREYAGSKRIARLTILAETVVVAFMVVLGADRTATVFIMFAMILSAFLLVLAKIFGQEAEGT